jgi:hypothetical protein
MHIESLFRKQRFARQLVAMPGTEQDSEHSRSGLLWFPTNRGGRHKFASQKTLGRNWQSSRTDALLQI